MPEVLLFQRMRGGTRQSAASGSSISPSRGKKPRSARAAAAAPVKDKGRPARVSSDCKLALSHAVLAVGFTRRCPLRPPWQ